MQNFALNFNLVFSSVQSSKILGIKNVAESHKNLILDLFKILSAFSRFFISKFCLRKFVSSFYFMISKFEILIFDIMHTIQIRQVKYMYVVCSHVCEKHFLYVEYRKTIIDTDLMGLEILIEKTCVCIYIYIYIYTHNYTYVRIPVGIQHAEHIYLYIVQKRRTGICPIDKIK